MTSAQLCQGHEDKIELVRPGQGRNRLAENPPSNVVFRPLPDEPLFTAYGFRVS